jgi:hypothetical protein
LKNMPVTVWDGRGRAARHGSPKMIANQRHHTTKRFMPAVGPTAVEHSTLRHLVSAQTILDSGRLLVQVQER